MHIIKFVSKNIAFYLLFGGLIYCDIDIRLSQILINNVSLILLSLISMKDAKRIRYIE